MEKQPSIKKNTILSIIKQALKIAFPLVTFPYVSRVLLEENLGKYNFTLSIISYFSIFASLGINTYAIREGARIRENKDKLSIFANEIFSINLVTTLISYLLLLLLIIVWPKLHDYKLLLFVQSTTILAGTLGVDWINSIFEDFEYMTKRYVFVKLISLILIFTLVKNTGDYIIYACINSGIEILASLLNIKYVRKYIRIHITKNMNYRKHLVPMLVIFANTLAITIYTNSDITMIGVFMTDSEVGIYSIASKMYQIAKPLINAITIVTIPRLAVYIGQKDVSRYNGLLNKTVKAIILFMAPMVVGMFALSREIILFLGGEAFLSGQSAMKILTLALIPVSIGSIYFDGVLIANRMEQKCFFTTIICALINITLNFFMIPELGISGAAMTTLIAELICCLMAMWYSQKICKIQMYIDKDLISVFIGTIIIAIICTVCKGLGNDIVCVMVSVIVSVVFYGAFLIICKNSMVLSLWEIMKSKIEGKLK